MTRPAILSLTLATFAIGTTEFAVQGLLPDVAKDLGVNVPSAGLLITGYALGVALGGPVLALLTRGQERKTTLLGLMGVFIAGNVLSALAPDYAMLMGARVVASFCHGAFFGIGSVVAAGIVPADRRARAVAMMWSGIAAANILGIPAGTALGQAFGWRSTFWTVAAIGCLAMAAIFLWLPKCGRSSGDSVAHEFRILGRPQVLMALALTVLLCGATLGVFTFIAPLLAETASIAPGSLPIFLVLFGVGGVLGMQIGGRLADRDRDATVCGGFLALATVYLMMPIALPTSPSAAATMFCWGFLFYLPASGIQLKVVDAAHGAPNLASTLVQSGFNIGNAIGPAVSAAALSAGAHYPVLPWIACAMSIAGAGVVWCSAALLLSGRNPPRGKPQLFRHRKNRDGAVTAPRVAGSNVRIQHQMVPLVDYPDSAGRRVVEITAELEGRSTEDVRSCAKVDDRNRARRALMKRNHGAARQIPTSLRMDSEPAPYAVPS